METLQILINGNLVSTDENRGANITHGHKPWDDQKIALPSCKG